MKRELKGSKVRRTVDLSVAGVYEIGEVDAPITLMCGDERKQAVDNITVVVPRLTIPLRIIVTSENKINAKQRVQKKLATNFLPWSARTWEGTP